MDNHAYLWINSNFALESTLRKARLGMGYLWETLGIAVDSLFVSPQLLDLVLCIAVESCGDTRIVFATTTKHVQLVNNYPPLVLIEQALPVALDRSFSTFPHSLL